MRAVVYTENGPSSVLSLVERPTPNPGPGEVRVRVVVAGVNPTDWKARRGTSTPMAFDEVAPGQDGAGVVDALGDGVDSVEVGQRVWLYLVQHGRPLGTAAEYVVVPADLVVPLPGAVSFDLGASLGVPALTAHRGLTVAEDGPTRVGPGALAGRVVLVQGGAGAVGNAAIQLASWAGATVVTTVSSDEKADLARAAGAHHVVDYRTDDVAARIRDIAPEGVHQILEVAPAQNDEVDREIARIGATIAIYANNGGNSLTLPLRETFSKNLRYQFLILYTLSAEALRNAVEDVAAAVSAGALRVGPEAGLPLTWFPLEQTAEAHDAVEAGVVGKVLLRVGEG